MTLQSIVLLGDSILKRLLDQFSNHFDALSIDTCVSGKTIHELKVILKDKRELLKCKQVVLMIGTNDLVQKSRLGSMCAEVKSLLRFLRRLECKVTVLEALPVARWGLTAGSQAVIGEYNKFLQSFTSCGVKLIKLFDNFFVDGSVDLSLYCKKIGKYRRVDLVHPNRKGCRLIFSRLREGVS